MRKILLWVALGLFVVVAFVIGISALGSRSEANKEKTAATSFVQKVLSDDTNSTYNMFNPTARDSQSKDDWGAQVDQLSSFFENKKPTLQNTLTSGTRTEVTFMVTGSDGDYIMTVTLVKDDSDLKVLSFTSQLKP